MIMIIILTLTIIYIKFGLFVLIQILIWTLVFILSNFLIGINPSKEYYIIRIMAIIVIIFILYYNSKQINILTSLILPFSITKINYLDEVIPNNMFISNNNNNNQSIFYFSDVEEIIKWLNTLDENQCYVVTFDFILSILTYNEDSPVINLTKPILVSRDSNPRLISDFLKQRISLACDSYYLPDEILVMLNKYDGPATMVQSTKLNLF